MLIKNWEGDHRIHTLFGGMSPNNKYFLGALPNLLICVGTGIAWRYIVEISLNGLIKYT